MIIFKLLFLYNKLLKMLSRSFFFKKKRKNKITLRVWGVFIWNVFLKSFLKEFTIKYFFFMKHDK